LYNILKQLFIIHVHVLECKALIPYCYLTLPPKVIFKSMNLYYLKNLNFLDQWFYRTHLIFCIFVIISFEGVSAFIYPMQTYNLYLLHWYWLVESGEHFFKKKVSNMSPTEAYVALAHLKNLNSPHQNIKKNQCKAIIQSIATLSYVMYHCVINFYNQSFIVRW
jgi:hypothetical protein